MCFAPVGKSVSLGKTLSKPMSGSTVASLQPSWPKVDLQKLEAVADVFADEIQTTISEKFAGQATRVDGTILADQIVEKLAEKFQLTDGTPIDETLWEITAPGRYYLQESLPTHSLNIASDFVMIDMNGRQLQKITSNGYKNITIMGGFLESGITDAAIYLTNCQNFALGNLVFKSSGVTTTTGAIHLNNCENFLVQGAMFRDCPVALYVDTCDAMKMESLLINNSTGIGVVIANSRSYLLNEVAMDMCTNALFSLNNSSYYMQNVLSTSAVDYAFSFSVDNGFIMSHCSATHGGERAFKFTNCDSGSITNCGAYNNVAEGFALTGISVESMQLNSCMSVRNKSRGFLIDDADGIAMNNCLSAFNTLSGFRLAGSATGCVLDSCLAYRNEIGIELGTETTSVIEDNVIKNCDSIQSSGQGILLWGQASNNVFIDNVLTSNGADGVYFKSGGSYTGNIVTKCVARNNTAGNYTDVPASAISTSSDLSVAGAWQCISK